MNSFPYVIKIQETREYIALSTFVLKVIARPYSRAARTLSVSLFTLAIPHTASCQAYAGEALRPLGAALYKHSRRVAPLALRALKRRPMGKRPRPRAKPYASHLLRLEAPFVEQPLAIATAPDLAKLRPHWLSNWSPNDLRGWDRRLSLISRQPRPKRHGFLVYGANIAPGGPRSGWHPLWAYPKPRPGVSLRFKGGRARPLKLWLSTLIATTSRLAHYHAWYHLFSLLPLSMALVAVRSVGFIPTITPRSTRARGCPQHLLLWRDLSILIRAPYLHRPNSLVLAGIAGVYTKYLTDFFEAYTKTPVCLHFVPYSSSRTELAPVRLAINACVYPALKVFHRLFFYKDFATLCTMALHQKNATLLVAWLTRFMERIDARMHKKFLRFLSVFFRRVHESKSPYITHTGIKFIVKGKISVSGSAKKRTQHIAYGTRSLSRKSHRISFCQGLVRTPTGVLGLKCFIFY